MFLPKTKSLRKLVREWTPILTITRASWAIRPLFWLQTRILAWFPTKVSLNRAIMSLSSSYRPSQTSPKSNPTLNNPLRTSNPTLLNPKTLFRSNKSSTWCNPRNRPRNLSPKPIIFCKITAPPIRLKWINKNKNNRKRICIKIICIISEPSTPIPTQKFLNSLMWGRTKRKEKPPRCNNSNCSFSRNNKKNSRTIK
jgi:hypothetical protein